jgi:hypothetical protein
MYNHSPGPLLFLRTYFILALRLNVDLSGLNVYCFSAQSKANALVVSLDGSHTSSFILLYN